MRWGALAVVACLLAFPTTAGAACTLTPDTWHALPLSGQWADSSGTDWAVPGYRLDADGFVHLRGFITQTGGSAGASVATLPTGYRPARREMHVAWSAGGAHRVDVLPSGDIEFENAEYSWANLNGVTFDSETVTAYPFDCGTGGGGGASYDGPTVDDATLAASAGHSDLWFLSGLVAAIMPAFGLYRAIIL